MLAASITGNLVLAPVRGRLVDRLGAGRAVIRLAGPAVATDVAFMTSFGPAEFVAQSVTVTRLD